MDLLYISVNALNELREYCSDELLSAVLTDFQRIGKVIQNNDIKQHPTRFWQIESFINKESDVSLVNKLQVIIAFIKIGGIVETFGQKFIAVSILSVLQNRGYISEKELGFLNDPWFLYDMGKSKPYLDLV